MGKLTGTAAGSITSSFPKRLSLSPKPYHKYAILAPSTEALGTATNAMAATFVDGVADTTAGSKICKCCRKRSTPAPEGKVGRDCIGVKV